MKLHRLVAPALALALFGSTGAAVAQAYGPQYYGQGEYRQGPAYYGQGWDTPPEQLRDAERQGFRDGIDGARHDFENHRQPNPNNRDEFRHPHVPGNLRDEYREGFRKGYSVAVRHMQGGDRDRDGDHDHDRFDRY